MKRRTFLTLLGGTALVPLMPIGFLKTPSNGTIIGLRYYPYKLSNAATASLTADFVNDKYSINGIKCSFQDIVKPEYQPITIGSTSFIDYNEEGKCLGLFVGEVVTIKT